jgi:molecular chaperone DnaK
MNKPSRPAVGIDLGTTYSALAYLDDLRRPQTLINAEGDKLTPSAILFEGDEVIVGKEAIKALATEAQHVAQCAKRDLGLRVFHRPLGGREYPPAALQAWVLNKLRLDASRQIGNFSQAVITVPAYFDEVRRKATQDAGYIAGLDVLDIINEPTAAALAFGLQQSLQGASQSDVPQRVLVYDLGGGTFDVTVMEIRGDQYIALATDGDVQLGGLDWDERLVNHVATAFQNEHGLNPRDDPNTSGRLWRDCEDAKRTLSARSKTTLACDHQGKAVRIEVTRDEFLEMTKDLLERTAFTTRQTLEASGLTWNEIDHVLLVGGSTRMPAIQQRLREMSGKEPNMSVSPDEAVAHGAAIRAGVLMRKASGQPTSIKITNVNSHSLGVVATDSASRRARNAIVIPHNTPLPVAAKRIFKTQKADQKSILVQIVEGENSEPAECTPIGQCIVRRLPAGLAAQTPIEVIFVYAENGRLQITVQVAGTDVKLQHELARENSMDQSQLTDWRSHVSKIPAA